MDKTINYFLNANATGLVAAFSRAYGAMGDVRTRGIALRETLVGLGSVMGAGMFAAAVKEQINFADSLDDLSQKAGATAKELSTLAYAAQIEGMSLDGLGAALAKLSQLMLDAASGGKEAASTFKVLGVSIKNEDGTLRRSDEMLLSIADSFSELEDDAGKTAVAMRLFGRSGAEMIPFLNRGREGIEQLRQEARNLGLEIDNNTAAAAGDLNDDLARLQAGLSGITRQIATDTIPTVKRITEDFLAARMATGSWWQALLNVGQLDSLETPEQRIERLTAKIANLRNLQRFAGPRGRMADEIKEDIQDYEKQLNYANGLQQRRAGDRAQAFVRTPGEQARLSEEDARDSAMAQAMGVGGSQKRRIDPSSIANDKAKEVNRSSEWENELARLKLQHTVSLAEEKAFWDAKLKLTKAGTSERSAVEKRSLDAEKAIKEDGFAKQLQDLSFQQQTYKSNFDERIKLAQQEADLVTQHYGAESREAAAAINRITELRRQAADQQQQIDNIRADTEQQRQLAGIDLEERQAQLELDLGRSTQQILLDQQREFEDRRYEIQRAALERRLQLLQSDPTSDPVAVAQMQAQLEQLEIQHQGRLSELSMNATRSQSANWSNLWGDMRTGGEQVFSGLLSRSTSWQQAQQQSLQIVSSAFSGFVARRISAWLAGETAQTAATAGGAATRTGIEAAAGAESLAIKGSTALTNIATSAYEAAAGAYAAIAGIPYVGPFLAPAVAAGALAAVIGFGSSIFSARDGFDIPAGVNPIVQLHEEEMVLPRAQANAVRSMAALGDVASRGPAEPVIQPVNNNFYISANDAQSIDRMIRRNPEAVAAALHTYARRNGART
ncbi:MAG: hypothetical protein E2576_11010 [Alcaligenaceae bacterium]|nr:hypothetical protein [Alcaligenaceae bacterium SAGV5]MPS51263.1 hypothetical protein [Alcaligenaceae bacterium SAGV3]MPT57240.1 hypothetical protein [Alcaligenaceae bacterium]